MLRNVIPSLLEWSGPPILTSSFVRFCYSMISEESPLPWTPTLDASLAQPLRQIFLENISQPKANINALQQSSKKLPFLQQSDKKNRKAITEEANERYDILSNVLKTWCYCPLIAVAVR